MNINDPLRNAGMRSSLVATQAPPSTKSQVPATKYADRAMLDTSDFKKDTEISPKDTVKYSGNTKNYIPNSLQIKNDDPPTKIIKGVLVTLGSPIILPSLASHAVAVAVGNAQNASIAKDANKLLDKKNELISQIANYKASKSNHEAEIRKYENLISTGRETFAKMLEDHLKSGKVFDPYRNRESVILTNYQLKTEIYFVGELNQEKAHLSSVEGNIKLLEKELSKINGKLDAISSKNIVFGPEKEKPLLDKKNALTSEIEKTKAIKANHEEEIRRHTKTISERRETFPKMLEDHLKTGKVFDPYRNSESVALTNYYLKTEVFYVGEMNEEKTHLNTIDEKIKVLEKELSHVNEKLNPNSKKEKPKKIFG